MNVSPPDRRKNMRELALEIGIRVLLFGVFVSESCPLTLKATSSLFLSHSEARAARLLQASGGALTLVTFGQPCAIKPLMPCSHHSLPLGAALGYSPEPWQVSESLVLHRWEAEEVWMECGSGSSCRSREEDPCTVLHHLQS
ncbi:hypothetical protein PAMP_001925 [Pampus punctatissimus]